MMRNYRSTPQILASANSLIDKNLNRIKKDLVPTLPDGARVVYHHAATTEEEARWIAFQVRQLAEQGVPLGDVAVLYRAHYVSRVLEEVFLEERIPYRIFSGVQFFGRMEIKDALSYLRLIVYRDDLSFLRVVNVPKRNLGQRRVRFLQDFAAANGCTLCAALMRTLDDEIFKNTKARRFVELVERFSALCRELPVSELLSKLLDECGYEAMLRTEGSQERLDNLAELKQSVHDFEISCGEETTPEAYLGYVALLTNADLDASRSAVKFMTVHTAKGLEFPYVFVCAFNEGVFPSKKTATREAMEEERRLAFVALTRAEKRLFLSDAEGRNHDGSYRYPSRFIFDVDRELLDYTSQLDPRLVFEAGQLIAGSEKLLESLSGRPAFAPGDRVVHAVMGAGEVLEVDRDKGAYVVQFDSLGTRRKISMKAKLEPEG
jgi:DNA helicase-2/ATP-dependent DNA helicase PcrA